MFCMWGSLLHLQLSKIASDLWWDLLSYPVWLPTWASNTTFPSSAVSNHLTNLVTFFIKIWCTQQICSEGSIWSACLYIWSLLLCVSSSAKLYGLAWGKSECVFKCSWVGSIQEAPQLSTRLVWFWEASGIGSIFFSVHSSGKIKPKSSRDCYSHRGKGCDSVLTVLVLVEMLPSEVTKLLFRS